MIRGVVAATLVLAAGGDGDVHVLWPRSDQLSRAALVPFSATYDVIQGDGEERRAVGYWRSVLHETRQAGVDGYQHTWSLHFASDTVYDHSYFAAQTFVPWARRIVAPGIDYVMHFADEGLVVFENRGSDQVAETRHVAIGDRARFGGGGDFALATLDLRVGQTWHVPATATDPPEFGRPLILEAKVTGRERLKLPGGDEREAWVVEQRWLDADGEPIAEYPAMTSWLAPYAPYVLRRTGGPQTWELTGFVRLAPPSP